MRWAGEKNIPAKRRDMCNFPWPENTWYDWGGKKWPRRTIHVLQYTSLELSVRQDLGASPRGVVTRSTRRDLISHLAWPPDYPFD